jgi:uncharacterized protein YjbI with pentapeptide repeats
MQPPKLQEILDAHELWLASDARDGCRADLSGSDLKGINLSGANLRGAFMQGANLDEAILSGAELIHADLRDALLRRANLRGANLLLADFTGADLSGADLSGTTRDDMEELGHVRRGPRFRDANLKGADMRDSVCYMSDFSGSNCRDVALQGAVLEGANLSSNDLSGLNLTGVDLSRANLQGSDLSGVNFTGAKLVHANLQQTTLSNADVRGAHLQSANIGDAKVDGIRYDRATRFRGIRTESCYGSSRFRRFAQDQDYIEEFKQAHIYYYWIWRCLTDCGRSLSRVVIWSVSFMVVFGVTYYLLGEQAFVMNGDDGLGWSLFTTTYYSVVTFTTLGFGDITPRTPIAAGVVMIEVMVGYVMLGISISILAAKVARRS